MPPFIDLTGRRFGRWTVAHRVADDRHRNPRWSCVCDCGTRREVLGNSLRTGSATSCGCAHTDAILTHGMTGTPEFTVWQMMRQRCNNTRHVSYASYGGRGIHVCDEWETSFLLFYEHVGPRPTKRHTLDRIDNDRGYEPGNVRWCTSLQQGANKRNNRRLVYQGESLTVGEWCRRMGMPKNTLLNRLARGLSDAEALSRPVAHKRTRRSAESRSPR